VCDFKNRFYFYYNLRYIMLIIILIFQTLGALLAVASMACAQHQRSQHTTPIPILRQINKHNDDGSYSYGYEGGDGSFKIETKYANGEVYGKYGYVDTDGQLREIEYGATKRGFEPVGTGITVPPPTLDNNNNVDYDDDGQYHEDPAQYNRDEYSSSRPASNNHAASFNTYNNARAAQPQQQHYQAPAQAAYHAPAPVHHAAPVHRAAPVHHAPRSDVNLFQGHPAHNIDIATGSYTINYTG
jgi:hypothetical protein